MVTKTESRKMQGGGLRSFLESDLNNLVVSSAQRKLSDVARSFGFRARHRHSPVPLRLTFSSPKRLTVADERRVAIAGDWKSELAASLDRAIGAVADVCRLGHVVQLLFFPRQEPSNFLGPGDSDELRRVQHLGVPLDADGVVSLREVASR
jgi:hypothetical protein